MTRESRQPGGVISFATSSWGGWCQMADREVEKTIEALLSERRVFEPPREFTERANVNDESIYERAEKDPDEWWAGEAEKLDWFEKWTSVLEWTPPHHTWFVGGKLNVAHNCLDRHLA